MHPYTAAACYIIEAWVALKLLVPLPDSRSDLSLLPDSDLLNLSLHVKELRAAPGRAN
jgi:hypothetical protein